MIYVTNILAGPLLLIVWLIDVYLVLTSVRLVLSRLESGRALAAARSLERLTDPLPQAIHAWLSRKRRRSTGSWPAWLIVLLGGLALRYLVLAIILTGY